MAGGGNRATKGVKFHKGVARRVGGWMVRDAMMKMATSGMQCCCVQTVYTPP